MPPSQTYLVVGGSRGIGKAFVTHLAANTSNKVITTVRKPIPDFDDLPNVSTLILDQTNTSSIEAAASQVTEPIDTLIVNAAIGGNEGYMLGISDQRWLEYCDANIIGPIRIVRAFLPAMRKGEQKKIIFISSLAGSMSSVVDLEFGLHGPYPISKAALNMVAVQLHNTLHKKEGFIVVPLHPGHVATDMAKVLGDGGMPPSESVTAMLKVIDELKFNDSAKFLSYDGQFLPW